MDPTDSLQSALEPRGSSLPLEPVSEKFWDRQLQRPLLPGRTNEQDCIFRTARTAVVVVLKGSLYRNALFMIVIINYCYDYLIKDLYHTEEGTKKYYWFRNCFQNMYCVFWAISCSGL